MARSHPPSLIRLAERLIRDERLIDRGDVVLCACSGGPDSTALLHVLGKLRSTLRFDLVAHGVDHGLRAEATSELALAEKVARSIGAPFAITRVEVSPGGNLQARAREARRAALSAAAIAVGARRVATGHTADDRAETVLLRLLRGSGPEGLAALPASAMFADLPAKKCGSGLPTSSPVIASPPPKKTNPSPSSTARTELVLVRPLLLARRSDVRAHLARHSIEAAEDPSNQDPRFLRVRVRRELLPLMEDMSPGIVTHLTALADMLAEDARDDDALRGLGRAQRLAARRAKKCERPVKLRLAGGQDVTVAFSEGEPVLIPVEAAAPPPSAEERVPSLDE